jgi:hypothetical protein
MILKKFFLLSFLFLIGFMLSCNQTSSSKHVTLPEYCNSNHRISSGTSSNLFGNNPLSLDIDLTSKPRFATIGAKTDSEFGINAGAVFVLYYSQGIWYEDVKLKSSDIRVGDWFGKSVDIYDDIIVAGAPYKNCALDKIDCGAAYIFRRTESVNSNNKKIYNWTEEKKLAPLELNQGNLFGVDC